MPGSSIARFTVTHPLPIAPPAERLVTTGVPALDAALGGGVPRGQISELVGAVSSGRTAVLHRLLAQATGQGELAAVVDVATRLTRPRPPRRA